MSADVLLHETTSLCRECKRALPARVVSRENSVWMTKACPEHGPQEVTLSTDARWYADTRAIRPIPTAPRAVVRPVELGCPFDCGACAQHAQAVRLPVVTITSACNLDCPICYVHNKNDGAYHMDIDAFKAGLGHLVTDHGRRGVTTTAQHDSAGGPRTHDGRRIAQRAGHHRTA